MANDTFSPRLIGSLHATAEGGYEVVQTPVSEKAVRVIGTLIAAGYVLGALGVTTGLVIAGMSHNEPNQAESISNAFRFGVAGLTTLGLTKLAHRVVDSAASVIAAATIKPARR